MDAAMEVTMDADEIVLRAGQVRRLAGERVGLSGVVPVAEHDGTVRDRAVISTPDRRTEVFAGDEIAFGQNRYVVAIDVVARTVTLSPVAS